MKNNSMGWHPENSDNRLAYVCGFIGALYQFILNIRLPVDFWSKFLEATVTAGVCGFVGMVGKELFNLAKKYLVAYFKTRKSKK